MNILNIFLFLANFLIKFFTVQNILNIITILLLLTIVYILKRLYVILNTLISKFYSILGSDNNRDVVFKNFLDIILSNKIKPNVKMPFSKKLI